MIIVKKNPDQRANSKRGVSIIKILVVITAKD